MANKYTDRTLLDHDYKKSDNLINLEQNTQAKKQAYESFDPTYYARQTDMDNALNKILNRKAFSYDLNGDALYQQYKDNYINQGKMAMMDTMGQAAAMTGGYGNSYAATAGNQAYQSSLQNLNNVIPELYQLALQSYTAEGDRLNNNYNVLASDKQQTLSANEIKSNKLLNDYNIALNESDTAYNREYTSYTDSVNVNNENYWNEYNAGRQADQDAIANELAERQVKASETAAAAADKSAYYEDLISKMEEKYAGYLSPEMQKAASSAATKAFQGGLFTENELAGRNYTTKIDGKERRFDNYSQYVDALLESKYGTKLTENEVEYLKGLYGIE